MLAPFYLLFLSLIHKRRLPSLEAGRDGGAAVGPLAGERVHRRVSVPPSNGSTSVLYSPRAGVAVPSSGLVLSLATVVVRRRAGTSGVFPVRHRPMVV